MMFHNFACFLFSSWWYTDPETFEKFTPSSKFPPLWCYELGKLALHCPTIFATRIAMIEDEKKKYILKNNQNCPSLESLDKNDFQSFRSCRTYQAWVKVDLKCNLEITFHWKHPLPKTKWENKIWWKCKNIFSIWHFRDLEFLTFLWNIINAVFKH